MIGSKPVESELKFLEKQELIQVAIGQYDFHLNFHPDVSIGIETREVTIDGERCHGVEAAKKLLPQLGNKIERIKVLDSSDLEILFSSGLKLLLHLVLDGNESYTISRSNETWVF